MTEKNYSLKVRLRKTQAPFRILSRDFRRETGRADVKMGGIENFDQSYHTLEELEGELLRLTTIYKDIASTDVIGESCSSYSDPHYRG